MTSSTAGGATLARSSSSSSVSSNLSCSSTFLLLYATTHALSQKYLPLTGIQTFLHITHECSGVPQASHSCEVPHASLHALHVRLMATFPDRSGGEGGWDARPGRNVAGPGFAAAWGGGGGHEADFMQSPDGP